MRAPKDQHFLVDRNAVRRIADLVDLRDRLVLEIGPGEGILTGELLSRGAKVNAARVRPSAPGLIGLSCARKLGRSARLLSD